MRFLTQKITGVQRFAFSICQELDKLLTKNSAITIIGLLPNQPINEQYQSYSFVNIRLKPCGHLRGHLWEQLELPWFSKMKPLLNLCNTAPLFKFKQLITLHDAIFMTNLDSHKLWFKLWYRFMTTICSRTSQKVFTVSEFSKLELNRLLGINPTKICVLGNAVSINEYSYDDSILADLAITSQQFFLIIGSNSLRKNTQMIAKLFAQNKQLQDSTLVVVGGEFTNLAHVNQISAKNIIYTGYINDHALRSLYHHAKALLFPSLYEGFGIPVLEAMSERTPVIAADIPVLQEVCGADGALYFNPKSPIEVLVAIERLNNSDISAMLVANGLKRCQHFSWHTFASQIYNGFYNY